jgi:SAM-dependent methyltransferase
MEAKEMDVLDPGFASLSKSNLSGVLLVNVLSLAGDSPLAVSNAVRVLQPGGKMVILDVAVPAISGRLDREWGLKRFRLGEMRDLLVSNGLEIVTLRHFNLLGLFGWLWDSVVRGRDSISREDYAARDRFVPLARFLDKVAGPPIGRSLFAVARKK